MVQVGAALKQLFSNGVVKRNEMWITSKLWYFDFLSRSLFYSFSYSWFKTKINGKGASLIEHIHLIFLSKCAMKMNCSSLKTLQRKKKKKNLIRCTFLSFVLVTVSLNSRTGVVIIHLKMFQRHWVRHWRTCSWTMLIYIWYSSFQPWLQLI